MLSFCDNEHKTYQHWIKNQFHFPPELKLDQQIMKGWGKKETVLRVIPKVDKEFHQKIITDLDGGLWKAIDQISRRTSMLVISLVKGQ